MITRAVERHIALELKDYEKRLRRNIKTCTCGTAFFATDGRAKYCSNYCADEADKRLKREWIRDYRANRKAQG